MLSVIHISSEKREPALHRPFEVSGGAKSLRIRRQSARRASVIPSSADSLESVRAFSPSPPRLSASVSLSAARPRHGLMRLRYARISATRASVARVSESHSGLILLIGVSRSSSAIARIWPT